MRVSRDFANDGFQEQLASLYVGPYRSLFGSLARPKIDAAGNVTAVLNSQTLYAAHWAIHENNIARTGLYGSAAYAWARHAAGQVDLLIGSYNVATHDGAGTVDYVAAVNAQSYVAANAGNVVSVVRGVDGFVQTDSAGTIPAVQVVSAQKTVKNEGAVTLNVGFHAADQAGVAGAGKDFGFYGLGPAHKFLGALYLSPPVTEATAARVVAETDYSIIANRAGVVTLTLPAAAAFTGRVLKVRTIQAQTVVSDAANVVPLAGGAAGTAILAATAGKWATLQSDGANWLITEAN